MTSSAKDLLAQADELMRGRKSADELPVLTELIQDRSRSLGIEDIPSLTDRIDFDALDVRPSAVNPGAVKAEPLRANARMGGAPAPGRVDPVLSGEPDADAEDAFAGAAEAFSHRTGDTDRVAPYTREQFDAAVAAKLEQMGHAVYSQVMQQLELHATGELKRRLREALEPALMQVSLDIAAQVADETANQVQSVVAQAVDGEVARLRDQIQSKRKESKLSQ